MAGENACMWLAWVVNGNWSELSKRGRAFRVLGLKSHGRGKNK